MAPPLEDSVMVEEFGYAPTYRRVFRSIGAMSLTLAMASPILGAFVQCSTQILHGGYWGLTWGWLIPSVLFFPWALATAELCSSMPVNGANYWWTAALAPPSISRPVSFVAGITNVMTAITSISSFAWATSFSLLNIITIYTGWTPSSGVTFAVAITVPLLWLGMTFLRMQDISIFFNCNSAIVLITTAIFVIAMPISQAHSGEGFAKASTVFGTYKNNNDWQTPVAVPMTFFAVAWVVTGWNASTTVAEETHDASRVVPKAVVTTYLLMAGIGFVVVVILAFCITDMDAAAENPFGNPAYALIMNRWGAPVGFSFLVVLIINTMFGGASVLVTMACQIAAFLRDGGLIYNDKLAYVSPYSNMPVYSIIALTAGGMILLLVGFSPTASSIIYSLAVIALLVLYLIPMIFRIFHGGRWKPGPWNLGRFSIPIHAWSIVSIMYMVVMECFPASKAWTGETLNYTWVILLAVVLLSIVFWFTLGSKNYRRPDQAALAAWREQALPSDVSQNSKQDVAMYK